MDEIYNETTAGIYGYVLQILYYNMLNIFSTFYIESILVFCGIDCMPKTEKRH